ncbi:MAG: 1-acyl-sn-glycerol-3-phosphate acyltransferase, partial [bacterium]|nr:1-acyl-sn-glycerol-3-phosphate acyltransferase [bacterium]
FRIPIFGWALAATGCVSIDRGNRTKAIRSLSVAAQRIRDGRPPWQ